MKFHTMCRIACVLAGALLGTTAQAATELGWIMHPGDPADCKSSPMKAWPGNWLAMKQTGRDWYVAATKVSIVNGDYRSPEPADYLVEATWRVMPGPVPSASISRRGDDFLFAFDGVQYAWVQAAGPHYYLTDGTSYWNGAWLKMTKATNATAAKSNEAHRCGYNAGCHELLWAGDINRDGNPDLIVRFGEGEDTGLQLWLGERDSTGLYFQTAARGLYEYNMPFICALRQAGHK